jgi:hypothetical protein
MHRSSESIATLAQALAKAQIALVNPEKTMTATIPAGRGGNGGGGGSGSGPGAGAERSFRYAPLSSGLEIVRKTLGQHEIAVLQTTSLDEGNRMVRLNTVLARMPPANGSPRTGRSVRSARSHRRSGWERR